MFIKGADVSSLREVESQGGAFYIKGKRKDALEILKEYGINSVRLRLWVEPYDHNGEAYGGGTCDLDTVIELAKRAKNLGMSFLLDYHYSDFWADPSKQFKPKSWQNLDYESLVNKVYEYTKETLKELKNNDVNPEFVQVGNEITAGMLWDDGKLTWKDDQVFGFDNLAILLKAGIKAVREICPLCKIMLHLERSADNALYRQWFDNITARGVDFDIIGVSYYPYWHGSLDDMQKNLNDIIDRYGKEIMVAETSYAWTVKGFKQQHDNYVGFAVNNSFKDKAPYPFSKRGQAKFLKDIFNRIRNLKDNKGLGVYYWEPCWIPTSEGTWASQSAREYIKETHKGHGNEWANQTLFDYKGRANYALKVYKKF